MGAACWSLAQTFWVGGLWLLHAVVLPMLDRSGLAPLLVQEAGDLLRPMLVGLTLGCAVLQLLVLTQAVGLSGLAHDTRAQLLVTVLALGAGYLVLGYWLDQATWWLQFLYLALAACGLLLVMQPIPDVEAIRARRARH
ncbi:MAG: DUF4149 domain-containing protein [Pseudomonadota bacterium]